MNLGGMAARLASVVVVRGAGAAEVNGIYRAQDPSVIPAGFTRTCNEMRWSPVEMWEQLSDGKTLWFETTDESYIYWNRGDGRWWIDAPSGAGKYVARAPAGLPPTTGWVALSGVPAPIPEVVVQPEGKEGI